MGAGRRERVGILVDRQKRHRIFMDLERLNRLNAEGCPACGHKFSLGDEVVLACGKWEGFKYVHIQEAVFDKKRASYFERNYYRAMKKAL